MTLGLYCGLRCGLRTYGKHRKADNYRKSQGRDEALQLMVQMTKNPVG